MRKKSVYTTALRVGVSVTLLTWLFSKTDLATIVEIFANLPFSIWLMTVFSFFSLCTMAATRWFFLSGILGLSGKWLTFVVYYFIGLFFNLFLPTSIGGDFFKILFVSKGNKSMLVGTCSVVTDRLIGLLTMFLTGTGAVLLYPQVVFSGKTEWLFYISTFGAVGLFVGLPLLYRLLRTLRPAFGEELVVLMRIWRYPSVLLKISALSVGLNVILVVIIIVLAKNIGIDLHPSYYFAIFPLTAIITVLPVSFNGIGLREGAFVYLLSLQNVQIGRAHV